MIIRFVCFSFWFLFATPLAFTVEPVRCSFSLFWTIQFANALCFAAAVTIKVISVFAICWISLSCFIFVLIDINEKSLSSKKNDDEIVVSRQWKTYTYAISLDFILIVFPMLLFFTVCAPAPFFLAR